MNKRYFKFFLVINSVFLIAADFVSVTYAQEANQDSYYLLNNTSDTVDIFQLVQNTTPQTRQNPPSGSQIFPAPNERNEREGKKCMTVCARWGEECTLTDRGAGGTTRDCRRTCQQFTEECF